MPSERSDSVPGFMFGADPEFHLLSTDGRRISASEYFPGDTYGSDPPEIGQNGHHVTAELRSHNPFEHLNDMWKHFIGLVKRAYVDYLKDTYPEVRFDFSPVCAPSHEHAGGHVSISHVGREWYVSGQALITLPFWFGVLGSMCNAANKARYERSQRCYGAMGDLETKGYGGGYYGVEYRNLSTWLAPGNKEYRRMIQKMIVTILSGDAAEQVEYVRKVFSSVSGRVSGIPWNTGHTYGRRELVSECKVVQHKMFNTPGMVTTIMKQEAGECGYHEMDWLLDMLPEDDVLKEYNPPVIISPRETYNIKSPKRFDTLATALTAVINVHLQAMEAGRVTVFSKRGGAFAERVGVGWAQESIADPLTGEVKTVARDIMANDVAEYAVGLAYLAVRTLHRSLDGVSPSRGRMRILGAREGHGGDAQFLVPRQDIHFVESAVVREICRVEGVSIATWDINLDMGLKMGMRMSPSYIRYYLPALYILYRLGFIELIGTDTLPPELLRIRRLEEEEEEDIEVEAPEEDDEESVLEAVGELGELFG